jgi:hypothetical protein
MSSVRDRYGEAFRRAHHETWQQSELNQREYCEAGDFAQGVRQVPCEVQGRPQPPPPKLLYRRRSLVIPLAIGLVI